MLTDCRIVGMFGKGKGLSNEQSFVKLKPSKLTDPAAYTNGLYVCIPLLKVCIFQDLFLRPVRFSGAGN